MNQGRTAREEKDFFLFQAAETINLAEWMKRSAQKKLQTAMLYTQIEAAWELHCVCTK